MKNVLDFSKRHHRFFEEMTRIPHGSYHEEAYSRYLEQFAQERGLTYVRDAMNNVVMYQPASPGYEDHPPVAIQAHMDMVCVKDEGYEHDFDKDPLELRIEDGYLKAVHTTLGADNGTGVCYILALLDDASAKHPPLEAIFTVQEEVGMFGAIALDKSLIHASRFISLDCGGGDSIYVSSMGGRKYEFHHPVEDEPTGDPGWRIAVRGLKGGFSSSYFSGAENAIALCSELLIRLHRALGVRTVSLEGGNDGKKVASSCQAVFTTAAAEEEVRRLFEKLAGRMKKEVTPGEPECEITLEPCEADRHMTEDCQEAVLRFLELLPSGAVSRRFGSEEPIGTLQSWTDIRIQEGSLRLSCTMRGDSNDKLETLAAKAETLCGLLGFGITEIETFPAWEFKEDSQLCAVLNTVFRKRFGRDIGKIAISGGLECSIFSQIREDMDMIAMGPRGENPHTTAERLDLASFDELFDVFLDLMASI